MIVLDDVQAGKGQHLRVTARKLDREIWPAGRLHYIDAKAPLVARVKQESSRDRRLHSRFHAAMQYTILKACHGTSALASSEREGVLCEDMGRAVGAV